MSEEDNQQSSALSLSKKLNEENKKALANKKRDAMKKASDAWTLFQSYVAEIKALDRQEAEEAKALNAFASLID